MFYSKQKCKKEYYLYHRLGTRDEARESLLEESVEDDLGPTGHAVLYHITPNQLE